MHDEIMVANKKALSNCEQIFAYIISFLKVSLVLVDNANMSVRDKYNSPLFEKEYFILHYFGWKKDDLYDIDVICWRLTLFW